MSRHTSLSSFCESFPIQLSRPGPPSFHPHSFVSEIRSVLGGCSRFSRCCYLISVLSSHVSVGVGPQELVAVTWTRRLSSAVRIETLYATARIAFWLLRNGSYTSPLTHNRCSSTANFRATATTARFLAFFPPRSASFSPHLRRSLSAPKGPRM
jgi:hypothetical protein